MDEHQGINHLVQSRGRDANAEEPFPGQPVASTVTSSSSPAFDDRITNVSQARVTQEEGAIGPADETSLLPAFPWYLAAAGLVTHPVFLFFSCLSTPEAQKPVPAFACHAMDRGVSQRPLQRLRRGKQHYPSRSVQSTPTSNPNNTNNTTQHPKSLLPHLLRNTFITFPRGPPAAAPLPVPPYRSFQGKPDLGKTFLPSACMYVCMYVYTCRTEPTPTQPTQTKPNRGPAHIVQYTPDAPETLVRFCAMFLRGDFQGDFVSWPIGTQ